MYYRWEKEILDFPEELEVTDSIKYTPVMEFPKYMSINLITGVTEYYIDKEDFKYGFRYLMTHYTYSDLAFYKFNEKENKFEPLTRYDLIIAHDF